MAVFLLARLQELGVVQVSAEVPCTDALSLADLVGVDPSYIRRLLRDWAQRGVLEAQSVPQPGTPPIIMFRLEDNLEDLLDRLHQQRKVG